MELSLLSEVGAFNEKVVILAGGLGSGLAQQTAVRLKSMVNT